MKNIQHGKGLFSMQEELPPWRHEMVKILHKNGTPLETFLQ